MYVHTRSVWDVQLRFLAHQVDDASVLKVCWVSRQVKQKTQRFAAYEIYWQSIHLRYFCKHAFSHQTWNASPFRCFRQDLTSKTNRFAVQAVMKLYALLHNIVIYI